MPERTRLFFVAGDGKRRPVRRVWSNPIQALGGLKDVSDAQRKARAEWDSSTTSISLESAANLPQLQKQ